MAESTKHTRMLDELLEFHTDKMNEWQRTFCDDVRKAAERFALRPKQKAKVDEIWAEIVEGKGRQRGPVEVIPKPYKNWSVEKKSRFDFYVCYKGNAIGSKMTLDDCTTIMDWLSNSENDLLELFCKCYSASTEEPANEEPLPLAEEENLPEPF